MGDEVPRKMHILVNDLKLQISRRMLTTRKKLKISSNNYLWMLVFEIKNFGGII
jgi:hypothetical protein